MPCCTSPEMVPTGSSPLRSCPIFLSRSPQSCSLIIYLFNLCLSWRKWTLETLKCRTNLRMALGSMESWQIQWSKLPVALQKKKLTPSSHLKMEGFSLLYSFPFGRLPIFRCGKLPVSFRFRVVMMVSSSRGTRLRAEARLKTCDQICFVPPGNGTEQLVYEALKGQIFWWWYSRFQSFKCFFFGTTSPQFFFWEMLQFDQHIFCNGWFNHYLICCGGL